MMKSKKVFSTSAFRKGSLSLVLIVIVIIGVILVNILASAVSEQYPFGLDLTAQKDYTMTLGDEYEEFVTTIDKPIEIIVCADQKDFTGSTYPTQMVSMLLLQDYYNGISESTTKYAKQVGTFLKTFPTLNDAISVDFVNPTSVTEFNAIKTQLGEETLAYGDIIVCRKNNDGEYSRKQIVPMSEIFTVESDQQMMYSGYEYYNTITGSKLSSSMVSALYIVMNDESVEVAVIGGHNSNEYAVEALKPLLTKNNYTFTQVDNLLKEEIKADTDMVVIAAPQDDFTKTEVKKLETFLNNGGKYGRTLIYLPSSSSKALPVLEEYLVEWGIALSPAYVYDEQYLVATYGQVAESDYTKDYNEEQYIYHGLSRVVTTTFDSKDGYITTPIITSNDKTVGFPNDQTIDIEQFKVADATIKGPFDLAVLSTYQKLDSKANVAGESHVLVLSGDAVLTGDQIVGVEVLKSNMFYNSTLVLNILNDLAGVEEGISVNIEDKVISTTSFYESILNTNASTIVLIVFVVAIPVALIVASLIIWRMRKKK